MAKLSSFDAITSLADADLLPVLDESGGSYSNKVITFANLAAAFLQTGEVLSPAQITANQDDYAPTGLAAATWLRLSSDASRNITGILAGSSGDLKAVTNVGSEDIVLKDEDASSDAANRIATQTGGDVTLSGGESAWMRYDATSARWRVVAIATASAAGLSGSANETISGDWAFTGSPDFSGVGNASTIRTDLGLAIGTDVQAYDADTLKADTSDELTAGFTSAVHDIGNSGTGTVTVSLTEESVQTLAITGSFTLAPPSAENGVAIILATTDSTGGYTLTSSGFTKVNGEWTNTADMVHLFTIRKVGSTSILNIEEVA